MKHAELLAIIGALEDKQEKVLERARNLKQGGPSSAADRRLIEMAALDQASVRATRSLSGRCHDSVEDQMEHERRLYSAMETFKAYEELAKLDTLAEISAMLGGAEIRDEELQAEVKKLELLESSLELELEESNKDVCLLQPGANYLNEDLSAGMLEPTGFDGLLDGCTEAQADVLAEQLQVAVQRAGVEIELDSHGLSDKGKQEELKQLFGEGWEETLSSCLEPGDTSEVMTVVEEPDAAAMEHETLMDRAEDLSWAVKRELGGAEGEEEEGEEEGTAELMLLADMTPRQLVLKLLARNRRRRMQKAEASAEVLAARRALTGETARAACLDTVLAKWPDIQGWACTLRR